ncbi:hypothetical protein ACFONL_09530 [Camelimonas fluminis]|uniref:Uncharacterized protein n=1 Tax=Camelimonas fluminis TaxID=1576911 RepID=A0ABV7UFX2_9HYPH|nr:hypothetical protein [Camelimonas fluminis]
MKVWRLTPEQRGRRMLRMWVIWVVASAVIGVAIGFRAGARVAVIAGLAIGLCAFAINALQGDALVSAFWSMAAAGGGLVAGGLLGGAVMVMLGGRDSGA